MQNIYDLRILQSRDHLLEYINVSAADFDLSCKFIPKVPEQSSLISESEIPSTITIPNIEFPIFFQHVIQKRNKSRGNRVVWETVLLSDTYKALSRKLDMFFRDSIPLYPHPQVFGYVRGRNIRENAEQHIGKKYIIKTDIENFFPSIDIDRIRVLFQTLGVKDLVASDLAEFLTIENKLPLGLSPSPIIANAICNDMDINFTQFAESNGYVYSRYADDIALSSDTEFPKICDITTIIESHGFKVAGNKTRSSIIGQTHYVTGLSVTDRSAPHAPRKFKRLLRQELFFAEKYGLENHLSKIGCPIRNFQHAINRLDGLVKYVTYHEPKKASAIYNKWSNILQKANRKPSFAPREPTKNLYCIYFDESEFEWKGDNYLAIGISASYKQEVINEIAEKVLNDFLSNPYADGDIEAIKKNGLHYSDVTPDLGKKYIEEMRILPFKGYVAFAKLNNSDDYKNTYLRIIDEVIRRRLIAADSKFAFLLFEENSKIPNNELKDIIDKHHNDLKNNNNKRPIDYQARFIKKSNPGISVPDFLLGVLRRYLSSEPPQNDRPQPRERLLFERLRDKYRLIVNVDTGVEYSRRNPIVPE